MTPYPDGTAAPALPGAADHPSAQPPPGAARRPQVRSGALAMLPLLAGYAPFAVLVGVTVGGSSAPVAAWSGVWLIFAGSAHLAAVQLTDAGVGIAAAVAVSAVVNIRLLVFSATLARYWGGSRLRTRLVAAITVIDPTWMLIRQRFDDRSRPELVRDFYLGASLVLWFGWAALVTLGACVGNLIPPGVGLEALAPLCLLAMIIPAARTRPGLACLAASAAVAAGTAQLPAGWGTLLAMPTGVAAALFTQARVSGRAR